MREILFRGKRIDNGEWIEGSLRIISDVGQAYSADQYRTFIIKQSPMYSHFEVIPETIGQFTGLCDKNGKRIFEGDIVKLQDEKYEIVWGADGNAEGYIVQGFGCRHIAKYSMGIGTLRAKMNESVEVIGNIHDNPELLEVGVAK